MNHATKKQLMAIPVFTLLVTVGLVACDQSRVPTIEAMRSSEIQDVELETPNDEPGIQAEENMMERWQPDSEVASSTESTEFGQVELNISTSFDSVVFRVKEQDEVTRGWTRLIPSSTDSQALEPESDNRHSNETIATTQHQASVESLN
jgi:hypothetical protein